jgi:protein-tyrosine phosphatase
MLEMIDLHTHILSGLDDGAKTLEESIRMCWISYKDGVRTIVATPHTLNGIYLNDRRTILSKVQELDGVIRKLGVGSGEFGVQDPQSSICNPPSDIPNSKSRMSLDSELRTLTSGLPLKILPGADVRFCEEILFRLDQGKVMTIGDGGHFLSVEFPFQGIPYRAEEILFQMMARGIIPVISHPERNLEIGQRPQRYYEMIRAGCLGQVTAMSLTGEFGREVKEVVERLMKKRLVHFIASDAHSINGRRPILSDALRMAEKIVGKEEAWKMVNDYPQSILQGHRPEVPEPIPI